jgi:hypothetical protein
VRKMILLGAVALLVTVGIGPSASAASAAESAGGLASPVVGTFVGEIPGTRTLVAVVAGPAKEGATARQATIYLCDGAQVSTWFFGNASGNRLDLLSRAGGHARATLAANRAVGTVDLPGRGAVKFSAARASGVAGIYLVNRSLGNVRGFSGTRSRLEATVTRADAPGEYRISGTVTPRGGDSVTLAGTGRFSPTTTTSYTWIVLGDGRVAGGTPGNTTGTGNCSVWQKIKQIMTGVFCGFL